MVARKPFPANPYSVSGSLFMFKGLVCLLFRGGIMNRLLACLIFLWMPLLAFGQQWQSHQLTHLPQNCPVADYSVYRAPNGNLHFYTDIYLGFQHSQHYFYYFRSDEYGHILTDTVRLDSGWTYADPNYCMAVGDDHGNSWGLWCDYTNEQTHLPWLCITGRDSTGNERLPSTIVGVGGRGGTHVYNAAYWPQREHIMVTASGWPGTYMSINPQGDTVAWSRFFPEDRPTSNEIRIHSDFSGNIWSGTRYSTDQSADIVLFKWLTDTSLVSYYMFGHSSGERWGVYDFAVDPVNGFHLLVNHDSAQFSYVRLDSNLALLEWKTLLREPTAVDAALTLDVDGSCAIAWAAGSDGFRFWWALRQPDGLWSIQPVRVQPTIIGSFPRIASAGDGRWVLTVMSHDLFLFTYGFPPDAVDERTPTIPVSDFMLYPNPTNGGLFVQGSTGSVKAMAVFNVLGQQVISLPVPRGANGMFSLPQIDALSTGEYFLSIKTRNGETVKKFVVAR
jgi:hypothetical protein